MYRRGTILVVVMVTLIFAAAALVVFLDKATNELLVSSRDTIAGRLRPDAYSALETTLAALEDFRQYDNGLHTPAEGWGSGESWGNILNLPWVQGQFTPQLPNETIDIAFKDESGKIPLPRVLSDPTLTTDMVALFEGPDWGLDEDDANHLADVLVSWMTQNPTKLPSVAPPPDYEQDAIPYDPPYRSLRSYNELAAIDFAKDIFYDADGRPTALFWQFVNDFSLYNYRYTNINGANPDVMAAIGQFQPDQIANLQQYMAMKGNFAEPNPLGSDWFTSANQIAQVAGPGGMPNKFTTTIAALEIDITVHQGSSQYRLQAIVAPPGGAKAIMTTAADGRQNNQSAQNGETTQGQTAQSPYGPTSSPSSAQQAAAAGANLNFPFTILDIRENDEILTPPAEPPPAPSVSSPAAAPPSS